MKIITSALLFAVSTATFAAQQVDGHIRKDGTYVPPHYRTAPDSSRHNNWSSKPNVNPFTGERGTIDPNRPQQPTYGVPRQRQF